MRLLPNELGTIAPSKACLVGFGSALSGFWIFGDLGDVVEISDPRKSCDVEVHVSSYFELKMKHVGWTS